MIGACLQKLGYPTMGNDPPGPASYDEARIKRALNQRMNDQFGRAWAEVDVTAEASKLVAECTHK
jgi:hypothetical protein